MEIEMSARAGVFVLGVDLMEVWDDPAVYGETDENINAMVEAGLIQHLDYHSDHGPDDETIFIGEIVTSFEENSRLDWAGIVGLKTKISEATQIESAPYKRVRSLIDVAMHDQRLSHPLRLWLQTQEPSVFMIWGNP